jgi:hypothetical protein
MFNRVGTSILVAILVIAALTGIGIYSYNAGLAHGIAQSSQITPGATGSEPMAWHRHYGHWGFFPLFPFFFILLLFVLLRGILWRGGRWGRGCGYGYGYDHVPPAFEEWHRRAHAQPGIQQAFQRSHRPQPHRTARRRYLRHQPAWLRDYGLVHSSTKHTQLSATPILESCS